MIQNTVTMIGNLVEDPILRRTNTDNRPVANATIAVNEPTAEGGERTTYMRVVVWGNMALNFAASMGKGKRAIVIGRLQSRSYDKAGQKTYVTELVAQEIGASHLWELATPASPFEQQDQPEPAEVF